MMTNLTGFNLFIYAVIAGILYYCFTLYNNSQGFQSFADAERKESENLLISLGGLEDAPLRKLSDNLTILSSLSSLNVGTITLISDPTVGRDEVFSNNDSKLHSGGMDRIGEFRDLIVRVKGDFWQQFYVLYFIYNNFKQFAVIKDFEGNEQFVNIGVRVYGWEN